MRNTISIGIIGAALLFAGAASAASVKYTTMDSVDSVVTEGVRDCRAGAGSNVPLITWGGDMITIHANGNALKTEAGSIFANAGFNLTGLNVLGPRNSLLR